ncbi:outer membrane protein assembly factor [Desulfatiferula olefinivorans]
MPALLLVGVLTAVCPARSEDRAGVVCEIRLHVDGPREQDEAVAAVARNLLTFQTGMPYRAPDLAASRDALARSGLFESVRIPEPEFRGPDRVIDVYLTPLSYIRDVRIHGAFPLLAGKVKSAMRLYAGDPFIDRSLREREERVMALYRKSGYPEAGVTLTAEEPVPGEGVVISVWIDKGPFQIIDAVRIRGNASFSDIRLLLRTDCYKASFLVGDGRRFVKEKLDGDIRNLIRFYRDRGFADASVTASTSTDAAGGRVSIDLAVVEGPRYVIRFSGNEEFRSRTLRRDIDFSRRGNAGDMALKRGLRAIRERYRKAGYPDVYVAMTDETVIRGDRPLRIVSFTIDEGRRCLVDDLAFAGHEAFSDKRLKKQVLTGDGLFGDRPFVPDILDDDLAALRSLYHRSGFLDPSIRANVVWEPDETETKRAKVTVTVDEGLLTRVASLRFSGLTALSAEEASALVQLKTGKPFARHLMEEDERALTSAVSEKGYPLVAVTSSVSTDPETGRADVLFTVTEGPFMAMGAMLVRGNFRTQRRIIERETALSDGDPFSLFKFLESQRNIRNINAFSGADFREFGLVDRRDRVDLLVEVKERKPYYVQMALGYDTRRHGYVNGRLGDHNLFGLNKDAWIGAEYSQIGYRAESGVTEPRFLGTRLVSSLNLFSEKLEELNKDFGTRTYGASVSVSRDFFRYVTTALAFRYEYRDQYQRDADLLPAEDMDFYEGRRMVVTSPSITWNSTDSFIRPRKGLNASLSVDLSKALGHAPDEFLKYHAQARYYLTPVEGLTLALRLRYGYIQLREGTTRIPDDQLFFLGGTADVRGFDENMLRYDRSNDPEGGRDLALAGFEIRKDLGRRLELTTFVDTGRIGKSFTHQGDGGFRTSVGAGLRYITPIGPLGFLYGIKLDPRPVESPGQFHFTLGYSF